MLTMALVFATLEIALAVAAAVSLPVVSALLIMAGVGFAMSITMALANTTVQTAAPDALRGRVMSIYMTVFAGTTPFGALLAGGTSNALGTPVSIALGGGVVLFAVLGLGLRSRSVELARRGAARPSLVSASHSPNGTNPSVRDGRPPTAAPARPGPRGDAR
jgi:MFS family permease